MAYKGFNVIDPATATRPPAGWGGQEAQNWKDMADTVCGDTVTGAMDKSGHKHKTLYDASGHPIMHIEREGEISQVVVDGYLNVQKDLDIGGNLQLGGGYSTSNLTVYGNQTINGDLNVTGKFLGSFAITKLTGNDAEASPELAGTLRYRDYYTCGNRYIADINNMPNVTPLIPPNDGFSWVIEVCAPVWMQTGGGNYFQWAWWVVMAGG